MQKLDLLDLLDLRALLGFERWQSATILRTVTKKKQNNYTYMHALNNTSVEVSDVPMAN